MDNLKQIMKKYPGIHIVPLAMQNMPLPEGWEYRVIVRNIEESDVYVMEKEGKFGLRKQFLINLASDAGVEFGIDGIDIKRDVDANGDLSYTAKASGKIKIPFGEKTYVATHTEELPLILDKFRKSLENGLKNGIPEERGKELEKTYQGSWKKVKNKDGQVTNRYFLNDDQVEKYLKKRLKEKELEERQNMPQRIETLANMRLIKSIVNIDHEYPIAMMMQPFVVIRPVQSLKIKQELHQTKMEVLKLRKQVESLQNQQRQPVQNPVNNSCF